MEGPTPVSALIHAATMVTAGVYLLHRTSWLFALTPDVLMLVAWIGAFTALLAAVLACVQDDIKRVLAYSTVSQLGYMMAAIGAGFSDAGFFHLLTHGLFKALLFLGAGAVIHAVGSNDISYMGKLARKLPMTAIVFLIGTLSLAGIPLFAGYLSKEEILGATWAAGLTGPFIMLMTVAFLTAFYMFRVVFLAFYGEEHSVPPPVVVHAVHPQDSHDEHAHAHAHAPAHGHAGGHASGHASHMHDPPASMLIPLLVLALLSLLVGAYTTFVGPLLPVPAGEAHEAVPPGWLTPSAVGVAVAGILLAFLTYQRRAIAPQSLASMFGPIRTAAIHKFWIDDVFVFLYSVVLLTIARVIGWVDRYIVDGVLNVVSAWTLTAGDDLRTIQTGKAQDYVYGVAVGVLALILWMKLS
jgi:NADH-quinone oxidoreductase subunit L